MHVNEWTVSSTQSERQNITLKDDEKKKGLL